MAVLCAFCPGLLHEGEHARTGGMAIDRVAIHTCASLEMRDLAAHQPGRQPGSVFKARSQWTVAQRMLGERGFLAPCSSNKVAASM